MDVFGSAARTRPIVLLADDDAELREAMSLSLALYGFDVVPAKDGDEAWKLFRQIHPDLVIADVYMPFVNGVVLLNRIKVKSPYLPVLLMTGYSHFRQLLAGSRFPPDGFLNKPIEVKKLFRTLDEIIEATKRHHVSFGEA